MTLRILSVQHDRHGLAAVEQTSDATAGFVEALRATDGIDGVVGLATCNRVELIVDAPGVTLDAVRQALPDDVPWDAYAGDDALEHLFRVASGLESMVVGEREIAGQVRRALSDAQDSGAASPALSVCVEEALKASRRVARETQLAGAGRSVVSVALDLAAPDDWSAARVLLVGTGSFAGAAVAALRQRGAHDITVHSASGRANAFAASHGLTPTGDLPLALAHSDVVVCCRGAGTPVITADLVAPGTTTQFVDLALHRDVAPEVADLPGVLVIDLATVQRSVPAEIAADAEHAREILAQGMAAARTKLRSKVLNPAVVGLREAVLELVADEVQRLPDRELSRDDAAHALRRLATRLLHVPSMRAREAAATGRTEQYLSAMAELYGIGTPDDGLDDARCPATGLAVADLDPANTDAQERTA